VTFSQSLIVVALSVPVLAIVCAAVAKARRKPDRADR